MKEWLMAYFSFSKKERVGVIALMVLVLMIWLLPRFFGQRRILDDGILARSDSLLGMDSSILKEQPVPNTLFEFDPNLATDEDWLHLGLRERTVKTIRNYLLKGGKFRKPDDLLRIYGIRQEEAEQLLPYVRINGMEGARGKAMQRPSHDAHKQEYRAAWPRAHPPSAIFRNVHPAGTAGLSASTPLELNSADAAALEALPGIGAKLSARIIKFRDNCGGFYTVEQLAGVYGLSDTVYMLIAPRLRVDLGRVRKIAINTVSADSLDRHPYVQRHEARAIEQYRRQHGPFRDTADLARVHALTADWLLRMAPYLEFRE